MPQSRRRSSSSSRSQTALRGPLAILFLLVLAAIYIFQQAGEEPPVLDPQTQPGEVTRSIPQADPPSEGGAIAIYFSDPLSGASSGGPETALVEAINAAQKSVDVAIYNISLPNVTEALIAAHERGVLVRMAMESESLDGKAPEQLLDAGISILGDQREGLMHHKFVIIDSQEVWTGSFNFTSTAAYKDFNNLIRLRSQRAAQNYAVEFDELFVEGLFGPKGRDNTPYPQVTIDGVPVEFYFSPDDGVADEIVAEIEAARQSIHFLAYSFTSDPIAEAMRSRAEAGVEVRGVFDESQNASNRGGEYPLFLEAGFDVKLDGIGGLLHDKVIIIDGQTVIAGSYNFSASAENNNDENIVIFHDPTIAAQYLQHFEQVYANGQ